MSGFRRVVLPVCSGVLLALSLLGLFGYLHSGGMPVTIAFSAFAPYLLALALPAGVGFAAGRRWWAALPAVGLVVVFVVVQAPLWIGTERPDGRRVVVMTSNLAGGRADPAAIVDLVRLNHVDVLMTQELTPQAQRRLVAAGLDRELTHRVTRPGPEARGTGLWSRFAVTEVPWYPLSFNSVVVRAAVPGMRSQPFFVALHVGGPIPDAYNWSEDLRRLPIKFGKVGRQAGGAPVVAAGDYNATRSVPQFRKLLGDGDDGFADAADQAGAGLTRSFPADSWLPPLLGIDRVVSRGAVAGSVDTVTVAGSDHRAVVVRMTLADTR